MRLGLGLGVNKGRKASGGSTPLLDLYPGAEGAYSLRYLNSAYTGDVVLVRRSSDNAEEGFTPNEITDGTLASFAGATSSFVKTWYDQSGNGNDITNTTNLEQPTITSSGSVVLENGKPAIDFSGARFLFNLTVNLVLGNSAYATFSVQRGDTALSTHIIYALNYQSNGAVIGRLSNFTTEYASRVAGNVIYNDATSGVQELTSVLYPGTTIENHNMWVNGVESGVLSSSNGTSPMDIQSGGFGIGATSASSAYSGTIQEVIIYASDQSSVRGDIESNILTYYGIS